VWELRSLPSLLEHRALRNQWIACNDGDEYGMFTTP
jgi:hypothetical protein